MHVSWAFSVVQRTSMLHACHRARSSSDSLAKMLITFMLLRCSAGSSAPASHFCNGSFASVGPDHGDFRSTPVNGHSQDRRACLKGANNGSGHLVATVDDTLRADPLAREYQVVDSVHAWFSVGGQSPKIRAGRRAPARSPDLAVKVGIVVELSHRTTGITVSVRW